ncbi:MAG TPA: universal stress protein [Hyphomicrobiaceae bacterium]|jgi:nucleotide-binding universal stress UspA family protein
MQEPARLQRLLLATDLSSRSDRAFHRAAELARTNKALLTVLHVIPDELNPDYADALKTSAKAALEKQVSQEMAAGEFNVNIAVKGGLDEEAILKQVREGAARGDFSVEVRIEAGSIYDIIIQTADAANADLIICGVHHRLMIGDEWLGSTIDRVLRFGNRPVLVVKSEPENSYKSIVVGVDFSEASAEALAFAYAAFPSAKFTLLNAVESSFSGFLSGADASQEAFEKRREDLRRFSEAALSRAKAASVAGAPEVALEVRQGAAVSALDQYVTEHKADLVVVGTHGRTGLRRAILGSVAESSIARLPCDVLAVRPQSA